MTYTISILPLLPNIRALHFSETVATALRLVGTIGAAERELQYYRDQSLKSVASKIEILTLTDFHAVHAPAVIRRFPNLKVLCLDGLSDSGEWKVINDFEDSIAALSSLIHLSIDLASEAGWPPYPFTRLQERPPPLRCLQLRNFWQDDSVLWIITPFRQTLEFLDLDLDNDADGLQPYFTQLDPVGLPRLTTLNVHTSLVLAPENLLSPFREAPLLQSAFRDGDLEAAVRRALEDRGSSTLQPFFESWKSLHTILAFGSDLPAHSYLAHRAANPPAAALRCLHQESPLVTEVEGFLMDDQPWSPFFSEGMSKALGLEHTSHCLRRTLDFGLNEVTRMVAERNEDKARACVKKLKDLEEMRWEWKD